MEKKSKPVAPLGVWVKNKIIKIITFFTCVVLILVNIFIYTFSTYGFGYKYYKNNAIQIGVTQQDDFMTKTLNQYLDELGDNGYYIYSTEAKIDIINKSSIIKKSEVNDKQLQKRIRDSITVYVFSTKLSIENDNNIYYFKSEGECNEFVSKIKEYNENINVVIDSDIIEIEKITNEQKLQDKIEEFRLERESKDREAAAAAALKEQQLAKKNTVISRGGYIRSNSHHPLDSYVYISSYYGNRSRGFHTGVDFATSAGTEVHAWKSGTVIFASWSGGYGNYIRIQHDDGTESCYAHLSGYACSVGDYVNCYETIGYVGSTGNSTGPHLHFEVKINGEFVNPLNYL